MSRLLATAGVLAVLLIVAVGTARVDAQENDRLDRIGRELDRILKDLDAQGPGQRVAALREAQSALEALLVRTRELYQGATDRGGERERVEFHLRYMIRWTGYLLQKSGSGAEAVESTSPAEDSYRRGLERLEAARRYEAEHPEDRVGIAERYLAALGQLQGRKEERVALARLNTLWAELGDGVESEVGDPHAAAGGDPGGAKPTAVKPGEAHKPPTRPEPVDLAAPAAAGKLTAAKLKQHRQNLVQGTPAERIEAVRAIASVDQSWVGGLLVQQLAREEDGEVRNALTEAVLRVGNRHVVRALGKWKRLKDPARRREAIGLLSRIGGKEAGTALCEFAQDDDEATTRMLIQAAKGLPNGYGVPALARVGKSHVGQRFDVIEALGQTGHGEAAKVLISFLHRRKFSEYKDPAVKALRMLGPAAIPPLIDALDGRDYRQYAAVALRSVTGERFGMSRSRWVDWWRKNRKRLEGASGK